MDIHYGILQLIIGLCAIMVGGLIVYFVINYNIKKEKEDGCKELNKKFDKFDGDIIVTKEKIEEIKKSLDQKTKDDIQFSHERVRKFAEAQLKNYGQDFERKPICQFIIS